MITITVRDGADVEAVRDDLQAAYPAYDIRTNEEQLVSCSNDRLW